MNPFVRLNATRVQPAVQKLVSMIDFLLLLVLLVLVWLVVMQAYPLIWRDQSREPDGSDRLA